LALIALALAWRLTAAGVLLAGLAGLATAVVVAVVVLHQRLDLRAASAAPAARLAGLATLAWPALLTSVGATILTLADQAVVGAVGGPVDAAYYGLGLRVSTLLSLPLAIVNMTIVPHIVADWTAGRRRRLQWLLTTSASAAAAAAVAGLGGIAALFAIGPEAIWGPSYAPALTVAAILGLAQVFHTTGGSSGYLLMLLGHQKVFMRVSLITGALAIAVAPWAMASWGIVGVAIVMAAAMVAQTIANARLARRLLALDPRPRPINPFRWRRLASE
jgi:O-antigen/teichoic acid export membrane protein